MKQVCTFTPRWPVETLFLIFSGKKKFGDEKLCIFFFFFILIKFKKCFKVLAGLFLYSFRAEGSELWGTEYCFMSVGGLIDFRFHQL